MEECKPLALGPAAGAADAGAQLGGHGYGVDSEGYGVDSDGYLVDANGYLVLGPDGGPQAGAAGAGAGLAGSAGGYGGYAVNTDGVTALVGRCRLTLSNPS